MDSRFGHEQARTLGAYVLSLHPGCACVCCGATLRGLEVRPTADSSGVGTTSEPRTEAIVICPRCGCEVAEVGADGAAVSTARVWESAA